jgi:hypothetical protein
MTTGDLKSRRIKPTVDTHFHIDYAWWEREGQDLKVYLASLLPEDSRKILAEQAEHTTIDVIDPQTAEVRQIDPLEQALRETEIDLSGTPVVDAIFRIFLTNGNTPLTPNELGKLVNRPATTILRTIGGMTVYRGIRPVMEE